MSAFEIESAREAAGSQASSTAKAAERPLLCIHYHLINVSFVLMLVGLVLPPSQRQPASEGISGFSGPAGLGIGFLGGAKNHDLALPHSDLFSV